MCVECTPAGMPQIMFCSCGKLSRNILNHRIWTISRLVLRKVYKRVGGVYHQFKLHRNREWKVVLVLILKLMLRFVLFLWERPAVSFCFLLWLSMRGLALKWVEVANLSRAVHQCLFAFLQHLFLTWGQLGYTAKWRGGVVCLSVNICLTIFTKCHPEVEQRKVFFMPVVCFLKG